jgi:hypothetical protein
VKFTLRVKAGFAGLVLSDLVLGVLLALGVLAESVPELGNVHLVALEKAQNEILAFRAPQDMKPYGNTAQALFREPACESEEL